MSLIIFLAILSVLAAAVVYDRARSSRRERVAALLEDSRYSEAVELLWRRRESPVAYREAVEYLESRGVARAEAIANLCRILGLDQALVALECEREPPPAPAAPRSDPWDRKPTPAISSAMLLPLGRR